MISIITYIKRLYRFFLRFQFFFSTISYSSKSCLLTSLCSSKPLRIICSALLKNRSKIRYSNKIRTYFSPSKLQNHYTFFGNCHETIQQTELFSGHSQNRKELAFDWSVKTFEWIDGADTEPSRVRDRPRLRTRWETREITFGKIFYLAFAEYEQENVSMMYTIQIHL